jgi:hypothetical protein
MIGIKVNSKYLELFPKTKVALEFNNSVFDDEVIQGELTLPFDIPVEGNGKLLGFFSELLLAQRAHTYSPAPFYFNQNRLYPGILDLLAISKDSAQASLRLNMSGLTSMYKKLSELDLGEYFVGATQDDVLAFADAQWSMQYDDGADFNFPMIYNPDFYNGNNTDYEGFMNNFEVSAGFKKNTTTNRNTLVPMAFMMHVLNKGFEDSGYTLLEEGFIADPVQRRLILYNNYALDRIVTGTSANGLHTTCEVGDGITYDQSGQQVLIFDNDFSGDNYDALGAYDPSNGEYTIQAAGSHAVVANIYFKFTPNHPFPPGTDTITLRLKKGSTILKTVMQTFVGPTTAHMTLSHTFAAVPGDIGLLVTLTVDYSNSLDNDLTLYMNDSSTFVINDFSSTSNINNYKSTVILSEHVPDVTFGELLQALKKTFNLDFKFNHTERTCRIDYFDDALNRIAVNLSKRSVPGHTIRIERDISYKLFNFTWASDDGYVTDNFKEYNPSKLIGTFTTIVSLQATYAAGADYLGKYAYILDSNQIWQCVNQSGYKWIYYTDAWYDEIVNASGSIENRPNCSTLMMHAVVYNPSTLDYILYPKISQIGQSDEFGLGRDNKTSLRFSYYWEGGDYPYLTSINREQGSVLGTPNLHWHDGLLPFWQKRIDYYLNGEFVEKKMKLTEIDLRTFNVSDPIRTDNADFLVKQARMELGDDIGEATFLMMKK